MNLEELKKITDEKQFEILEQIYHGTAGKELIAQIDKSVEVMSTALGATMINLDTIGAMCLILASPKDLEDESTQGGYATGLIILVRLLKARGFSLEQIVIFSSVFMIGADSRAMAKARALFMAMAMHSHTAARERREHRRQEAERQGQEAPKAEVPAEEP